MKIVTRLFLASALALAAAAPALAEDAGMDHRTHASAHKRVPHAMGESARDKARTSGPADSMASEPAESSEDYGYRYFHDFGIGSQS